MDVIELTRQLVSIDSQNPGAGEREIAGFVDAWCRERGMPSRIVELQRGRPNVVVTLDLGEGPHLGLTGHLDTKPIGDALSAWNTPPLELTIDGDTAYGLGATDMKGAVAAMLVVAERIAAAPSRGLGKLSLVLTADEEQGSDAGAQSLIASPELPDVDALVIGEPSGIDDPWEAMFLVSRGICCFEVEITTTQGHSGLSPRLGRNASLVAADVLRAFESFAPPVDRPGKVPATPTVNPGMMVSGGVCFGVWPGRCTVGIEIRTVPGMDRDRVRAAIEQLVQRTVGDEATATITYEPGSMGWMPATEIDPDHPVVRIASAAAESVLGRALPFAPYPGGTDAAYFMGEAGVPTIVSLGPGWLSVAHGANEKVGVSQLHQAVDLYEHLARNYPAEG